MIFDKEANQMFAEVDRKLSQLAWAMSIDFDEMGNPDTNHTWGMPQWGFYVCWDDGDGESGPHLNRAFIESDGRSIKEQERDFFIEWKEMREESWEYQTQVSNI